MVDIGGTKAGHIEKRADPANPAGMAGEAESMSRRRRKGGEDANGTRTNDNTPPDRNERGATTGGGKARDKL